MEPIRNPCIWTRYTPLPDGSDMVVFVRSPKFQGGDLDVVVIKEGPCKWTLSVTPLTQPLTTFKTDDGVVDMPTYTLFSNIDVKLEGPDAFSAALIHGRYIEETVRDHFNKRNDPTISEGEQAAYKEMKCEERYREYAEVSDDTNVGWLVSPESDFILSARDSEGKYTGPWLRFYQDGQVESGILWGGDVWEAASEVEI